MRDPSADPLSSLFDDEPGDPVASTEVLTTRRPETSPGASGRVRRRRRFLALLVVAIAVAALAGAAFGPQVARNLSIEVLKAEATLTLEDGTTAATVTVPAGWHVVRPLGASNRIGLETPDGLVEIALTLKAEAPADTESGAVPNVPGVDGGDIDSGAWSTEHPTPDLTATYARLTPPEQFAPGGLLGTGLFADGSPEHPALVAIVGPVDASAPVIEVLVTSDTEIDAYLAEFAAIIASLEFAS